MKQTIVAIIPTKEDIPLHIKLSKEEFFHIAMHSGKILTLQDFAELWNNDEVKVCDWFIMFFNVSSSFSID